MRDKLSKLLAEARFAEDTKLKLAEFHRDLGREAPSGLHSFKKIEMLYEECYDPERGAGTMPGTS